jgi:ATP-dependent helicase/nuclease subunit B
VSLRPLLLLTPSAAAAVELPRRLAAARGAVAGLYPLTLGAFARAVAEPFLLGRGLRSWHSGHAALVAARLLHDEAARPGAAAMVRTLVVESPRAPGAVALGRTLSELRRAGLLPARIESLAAKGGATEDDDERLRLLARTYRRFHDEVEGRFADTSTLLRAARDRVGEARWLDGAEALVVDDLELEPLEWELLEALAAHLPVRYLQRERPPGLRAGSFAGRAAPARIAPAAWEETPLAALAPAAPPEALRRLRERLFEPPQGEPVRDAAVDLLTAPGEAAEVRSIVRRLLREAALGVPFEDMGVVLPRPDTYAALFTDVLERVGVPYRLHPSLPLRHGRASRSLLLLLRCRGLARPAVLEFLTFAPVPFGELLGAEADVQPAQWDAISREAGIVSGLPRWILGLRAFAESQRAEAELFASDDERQARLRRRGADAERLLRLVELLSATLDALSGEGSWPEWSERLAAALDQWVGPEQDRERLAGVVAELASLGELGAAARWDEVEAVLDARLTWERMPLRAREGGAVHVGALDAIAGLTFRVLAIPGLVEGGFPGVVRPDPFLLDAEREALAALDAPRPAAAPAPGRGGRTTAQLSLFDPAAPAAAAEPEEMGRPVRLPTAQDRVLEARRLFHRAVSQAGQRLILSYPRADARTGRERLPSLFFAAAASTLAGRPLSTRELAGWVAEDDPTAVETGDALDVSERDRGRVQRGGAEAVRALAAGSPFFKWSHLSAHERWSSQLTAHDGLVWPLPPELAAQIDPLRARRPISASALARYASCGFLYLMEYVLRLEPALEPEERIGLDPLERGLLFHDVAETFLRERRDAGELPVRDDEPSRARLLEIAREKVDRMVEGSPPRHRLIWGLQWGAFEDLLCTFLRREANNTRLGRPAYFEVAFGTRVPATDEPHSADPLEIDLGEGRLLRVSGKIDRIDVRDDGTLVLRDYKSGKAPGPREDPGLFRGGRQLQIPFYVLAAQKLLPGRTVSFAFLDYVDQGRPVTFDLQEATGESFRKLLLQLAQAMAGGRYVQEPAQCTWCDYTAVCGPQPLLALRRRFKLRDPKLQEYIRLRDYR